MAEVVVVLDHDSGAAALALVERLPGLRWAKVGATLFGREGPAIVRALRERGIQVFLDLKWHDIPNQVAGAVRAAAEQGVSLATVHGLGGPAMLAAAAGAAGALKLVAVTVLTSHDQPELTRILGREDAEPAREATRLARMAMAAGLHGVVTGPTEVAALRSVLGPGAWIVVPGIRSRDAPPDDQRRTADARTAAAAGATHLVVGRPITMAGDPERVYQQLCEEAK